MSFDPHKNLVIGKVLTVPSPAVSGTTLVLRSGEGARFPQPSTDGAFNISIFPNGILPNPTNAELARVTARTSDTLTITRATESSTARTIQAGDIVISGITKKSLVDIENYLTGVSPWPASLIPDTDNVYDIGSVLKEWKDLFLGGDATIVGDVTSHSVKLVKPFIVVARSEPADYVCDGTNDNIQIQAAIDEAYAAGGGTVFIKAGTYHLTAALVLKDNVIVQGEGVATDLQAVSGMPNGGIFYQDYTIPVSNVAILDMLLDCNSLPNVRAIRVGKFTNLRIERIKATNSVNTFTYHLGQIITDEATNKSYFLTFKDCEIDGCSGTNVNPFILGDCNYFIIDNFIQTNVTSTASNIVIYVYCRHGVVRNIVDDTAAPKSCLTMVVVSDISIHDCSLIQQTGAGIMISNSWNVRIVNNYFETTAAAVSSYPIWVPDYNADIDGLYPLGSQTYTTDLTISNNQFLYGYNQVDFNSYHNSSRYVGGKRITIENNIFRDFKYSAVSIGASTPDDTIDYITINNNTIIKTVSTGTSSALRFAADGTYGINNVEIRGNIFTAALGNVAFITGDYVNLFHVQGNQSTVVGTGKHLNLTNDSNIKVEDNSFSSNAITFAATNHTIKNNTGVNPDGVYVQGNVTGATTFNRVNGRFITATLTGNITTTLTAGLVKGDRLNLLLTQDGVGGRTWTIAANCKVSGGTLTLSTGIGAVDHIELEWDGINWQEVSRRMNLGGSGGQYFGDTTLKANTIVEITSGGGVTVNNIVLQDGANTFDLSLGSASLDIAAGSALDVNANLTVESASFTNQDLTTDAIPSFYGAKLYNPVNDASPELRVGSADAEELHIQSVYNAGAQTLDYVLLQTDVASATADKGQFKFNVDGTEILRVDDGGLEVVGTVMTTLGLVPDADDGAYLGQAGTAFSDLFLASGGVINWDSGNAIITHSAGILTFSVFPITPSSAPDADYEVANKKYVDDSVLTENLWDRATTTLSPHNTNDSVDLGSGNFQTTGSIGVTGTRILKGWFTSLAVTNTITGGVSGNAGTVTGLTLAGGSLTLDGADALTLRTTNATDVTLPTTGTLATLAGVEVLSNKTLLIDGTPTDDHTATGGNQTNTFQSGAAVTVMDLVYMGSGGKWLLTDADAEATASGMLAISLESKNNTEAMNVALPGCFVRDDTWNWTPGETLYIDTATAGQIVNVAPSGVDDVVRVIGYAVTADVIYFNPSPNYIVHV